MAQEQITKNLMIRASAGTGKTFAIATRFIWLFVVKGVEVRSILALTFSRLAAQEIYTKILERLWTASYRNEKGATEDEKEKGALEERKIILEYIFGENAQPTTAEIAQALNNKALNSKTFADALRKLLNTQHLGTIATLDSFILKFVRSYPLELGFQNSVSLIEDYQEKTAIKEANESLLGRSTESATILEAFRVLEKKWCRSIRAKVAQQAAGGWREFVRHYKDNLPTAESMKKALCVPMDLEPFATKGGLIEQIDFTLIATTARASATGKSLGGNCARWVLNPFNKFKESFKGYSGDEILASDGVLVQSLLEAVRTGRFRTPFVFGTNEIDLTPEFIEALTTDIQRADNLFLAKHIEKSVKRLQLVKRLDDVYDAQMRRAGLLTFSDLPEAQKNFSWQTDEEKFKSDLENLYYRFDSQFDHWALDEFQDTSDVQWSCLRVLVENAAVDSEKSVVTVGDLKQAIYSWRGGSNAPFQDMMNWNSVSGLDASGHELPPLSGAMKVGQIQDKDISRRYEKNVCDFINLIFKKENLEPLLEGRPKSLADWTNENCWREHEALTDSKTGRVKDGDYVKVIGVPVESSKDADETGSDDDKEIGKKAILPIAPTLLRELRELWQKHKANDSRETVGVLVRGNEEGNAWAKYLRREGLEVIWEGLSGVRDLPAVELVLALLTVSEHPEDTAAWQFIKSSPLPEILSTPLPQDESTEKKEPPLPKAAFDSVEALSSAVAHSLSTEGLSRTLQKYIICASKRLRAEGDEMSVARLASLLRAAVKYESFARPGDGIDAFKNYLTTHAGRELSPSSSFIRILTIHRSKGLGIDHVFVPLAETSKTKFLESKNSDAWTSENPGEWILEGLNEAGSSLRPEFKEQWMKRQEGATSENLHTYYVALTRAKKSMYVIFPFLLKNGKKKDEIELGNKGFSSVIIQALWRGVIPSKEVVKEFGTKVVCLPPKKKDDVIPVVQAQSFAVRIEDDAEVAYKRKSPSGAFRRVAASEGVSVRNPFADDFGADAQAGIVQHAALEHEDWSDPKDENKWAAPAEGWTEIWQEKAYELIENETWISGKIDRVTFYPDGRVVVADYKFSDKSDDELRLAYKDQMQDYVTAVRKLTQKTDISAELLVFSTKESNPRVIPMTI